MTTRTVRRLALACALTTAIAAGALAAAGAAGAATTRAAVSTSANWSGYAVSETGQQFSDVKGSWTVPAVFCPTNVRSYASFWVGLGGFTSPGVEQIGTSTDCRTGQPVTSAWYEVLPAPAVTAPLAVVPGDRVTGEVSVSGTVVTLTLANATTGQTFTTTQTVASPDLSSAEWIAEAPSVCDAGAGSSCQPLPLADFGTAAFSGTSATAGGHTGPIADPAWTATGIQLVPYVADSASSIPSALSADGLSFTVSTRPVAAPPAPATRARRPSPAAAALAAWARGRRSR